MWQGQIPGQVDGTLVQYRIEGWRSYAEPNSVWSREMNLDRTVERPALYGYWVDNQTVPAWAHEAIVYHVFVDRFAGLPDGAANRWLGPEEINDFVGGSIRGVIDSLDYIAGTGATALWLSPVFVTTTYHGYDTTDYYHVDPRFGTDADLVELFEQAHRRGLRVILDFVANHTSVDFAPFVEARSDANSRYRRWFSFDEAYKHGYRAFFDVAKMPQFNTEEPEVRAFLNHAAQHWLALGADGLRLDYAAGPNHLFWSAFRAACRSVKPDCWLFGEVTRAGDVLRAYAGRLDGCLDFGFCRSIRMLVAGASPALSLGQFINQIAAARRYFGPAAKIDFVLPAFLDNHDMNRFLWVANDDKQRLRLALGMLFALGGPPVLYYGTEVGLSQPRAKGPHREEARHPMLWGEAQDRELLAYVQAWAWARRRHPSLGRGEVRTLYYGEDGSTWVGEIGVWRRQDESWPSTSAMKLPACPCRLAATGQSRATSPQAREHIACRRRRRPASGQSQTVGPESRMKTPLTWDNFREQRRIFGRPFVVAHRGAQTLQPENTLAAFVLALVQGADALETDLRFTADDELVLFHDATVERMTEGSGGVRDHSLAELRRLRMRKPDGTLVNEPVPTLYDLIAATGGLTPLLLELKDPLFLHEKYGAQAGGRALCRRRPAPIGAHFVSVRTRCGGQGHPPRHSGRPHHDEEPMATAGGAAARAGLAVNLSQSRPMWPWHMQEAALRRRWTRIRFHGCRITWPSRWMRCWRTSRVWCWRGFMNC